MKGSTGDPPAWVRSTNRLGFWFNVISVESVHRLLQDRKSLCGLLLVERRLKALLLYLHFSHPRCLNQFPRDKASRKWAALMVLLSPPAATFTHVSRVCSSLSRCSAAGIMLRAVLFRSLPTLRRLPVCHYSAAAIPAPSTQPEVHYNKVESLQRLLLRWRDVGC